MKIKHLFHGFNLDPEEKFLKTPVGIFLLGATIGELSPDPTDAIHFWLQEHVLNNPALSQTSRVFIQVVDWYLLSASYFFLLLILAFVLHIRKVNTVKRISVVGGVLGIGIVIGIVAQFIAQKT